MAADLINDGTSYVQHGFEVRHHEAVPKDELVISIKKKIEKEEQNILAIVKRGGDSSLIEGCLRDLTDIDCGVFYVNDCEAADRIMQTRKVNLIIADWDVMIFNGPNAIAHENIISVRDIPLVLLTDDLNLYEKLSAPGFEEHGIIDCVRKPVELAELKARVRLLLDLTDRMRQAKLQSDAIRRELNLRHQELHLELIIHSESVKGKILENIKTLDAYLNNEGKSKLRHLVRQFRWTIKDETNVNFIRAYDEMNSGLYAHLERICPKITKGEKRLCAFTLKNQSGTDIAKTIGKSQNSVNVAFARLRAKLGMATNKELRKFLVEITEAELV
jgi:DNA-binding response OmpR family regulator